MDTLLKATTNLLPYHLLSYGALLGTELYQSFINTKICFQALPMREFLILQKRLFPIYFQTQLGLVALTALTRPPGGIVSLMNSPWDAVSLGVAGVTGALNYWVFGPRTTTAAFVRRAVFESAKGTETKGKMDKETEEKVKKASKGFSKVHAVCIHLNAISMVATVWYAFSLASRLVL